MDTYVLPLPHAGKPVVVGALTLADRRGLVVARMGSVDVGRALVAL